MAPTKFSQAWRMAEHAALTGRRVVVTRPAQQAAALLDALRAASAEPLFFPVTEIAPLDDVTRLQALADTLANYALVFFVSANAIEQTLAVIPRARWPASVRIVTVGPGSARALYAQGFDDVILPESRFDSEGVLALPVMQAEAIADKRVLILRGDGGRELLAQTLAARGAKVDVLSCYQRCRADSDPAELLALFNAGGLSALSFTSSEGARNFVAILDKHDEGTVAAREMLAALPCFVPHPRIEAQLRLLGAQHIVLTGAGDAALVDSLEHHFR
jgi:uroporphyrinogen-III synthase